MAGRVVGVNADTLLLLESELLNNNETSKTANATAAMFIFAPFLNNSNCTIVIFNI